MSGNPRIHHPPQPPGPPEPWAGPDHGAWMSAVAGPLSFWRIVPVPFAAWAAALQRWQLSARDGELRLGHSMLRGPAERDPHFGTCRIQVRLARGPLRPPVRMQLHIYHWSATATATELIPCQRVRPSAAYFRAGHALLDALTRALRAQTPVPDLADVPPRQPTADQAEPRTAALARPAAEPVSPPVRRPDEPQPPSISPPESHWPG